MLPVIFQIITIKHQENFHKIFNFKEISLIYFKKAFTKFKLIFNLVFHFIDN